MDTMHDQSVAAYRIENEYLIVEVNEQGCLTHLERKASKQGNIIVNDGASIFRAVLKEEENWEMCTVPEQQRYSVECTDSSLVLTASFLVCDTRTASVIVKLVIRLDGDFLQFSGSIANHDTCMITDVFYPCIGAIKSLSGGNPDLLWPDCTGQRIVNINGHLAKGDDFKQGKVLSATYPGPLSMQWMSLIEGQEVLYYSGHDHLFHTSSLRVVSKEYEQGRALTLETDKLAFVRPGETWQQPQSVICLYYGSWRKGADEYVAWTQTWRNPVKKVDWIRSMQGYFLVIMKQQYGDEIWPYDSIPALYEQAKSFGCDTVGLFVWYDSGHDNQYPDLSVSDSLGGEDALKEGIKAVQEEGGRVTLYYQGHLMDVGSPYYQKHGKDLEGRTIWNTPYYEDYSKADASDFLKYFSKKKFSTVCPSCPEWHDLMTKKAKWVASFGPDGILYDQIGGMPSYPCFNENHPHMQNRPSLSYTQGRLLLLKKIHEKVRALSPTYVFMTEHETDVYSQFLDALHGIGVCPMPKKGKIPGSSWTSLSSTAPQMFRYCFPETIVTLRNPNPFLSPRYVNYAMLYGFRYELEIRYASDKKFLMNNEKQQWRDYARDVAQLRSHYADALLCGTYREQEGITLDNKTIGCSLFESETMSCIVLWNDTEEVQQFSLCHESKQIVGWETINDKGSTAINIIEANSVMVLLLS